MLVQVHEKRFDSFDYLTTALSQNKRVRSFVTFDKQQGKTDLTSNSSTQLEYEVNDSIIHKRIPTFNFNKQISRIRRNSDQQSFKPTRMLAGYEYTGLESYDSLKANQYQIYLMN
jgi:hypothetical protein